MNYIRSVRSSAITVGILAVLGLLAWLFTHSGKIAIREGEHGGSAVSSSRDYPGEKNAAVVLNSAQQQKAGIVSASVFPTSHQKQFRAYGSVVPVAELATPYENLASARSQFEKAKAVAAASQKGYSRMKELHDKNLASDQDFQAIQAQWQSDEAAVQSAQSAQRSLQSTIRAQWGEPLASWLSNGSGELDRLLRSQDILIEITLPADNTDFAPARIPDTALVQSPTDQSPQREGDQPDFQSARFVSCAQSASVQFQGAVLYYVLPSSQSRPLLGGMNINVVLPTSNRLKGIVVPRSSVVWSDGKAWFYIKQDSATFVRLPFLTNHPIQDGWFVTLESLYAAKSAHANLSVPIQIVTKGAQLLLSEEFRSQIQTGDEGDND